MRMRLLTTFIALTVVSLLSAIPTVSADRETQQGDATAQETEALARLLRADASSREAIRESLLASSTPASLRLAASAISFPSPGRAANPAVLISLRVPGADNQLRAGWVSLPTDYDGKQPCALVLFLHGGVSGVPADIVKEMFQDYATGIPAELRPSMVFMAIAAECDQFGTSHLWWLPDGQQFISNAVRAARTQFNIDDNRVYVTGMSDGGSASYGLAGRSPDQFAGHFPMVGHPLVPPSSGVSMFLNNFKGSRIYNISGGADPLYPGDTVKQAVETINDAADNPIIFKLYPEAGHDMSYAEEELPVIINYASQWRRELHRETIDWTADDNTPARDGLGFGRRRDWISIDRIAPKATDDEPNSFRGDPNLELSQTLSGPWRATLGIMLGEAFGPVQGVPVGRVSPGSVAEEIGLKEGDLITQIGDTSTPTPELLRSTLSTFKPYEEFTLKVSRSGEVVELKGKWDGPAAPPNAGRVIASQRDGVVDIRTAWVEQLSIWTWPEMLDADGKLTVRINGKLVFAGVPPSDSALVLDEFARTGDRTMPYCGRLRFAVPE